MNEQEIREIIRDELRNFITSDKYVFQRDAIFMRNFELIDAVNIKLATTTGTKIGTSTSQKLGFFNTTPVVQQAAITTVNNATVDTTYGAEESSVITNTRARVNELEAALEALGLIASN